MRKVMGAGLGMAALTSVLLFTGAERATTQSNVCAPREDLVAQLGNQFNEDQKAIGMIGEQAVMEVFASDAGTWTILTTDTSGTSCIVAAGEGWEDAFAELAGDGV